MLVGGEIDVGPDPISAEYHLVSTIPHRVGLDTTKSRARNRGKKAGLRLLSILFDFFGPSAHFRSDKWGVGGEIHVGSHSSSAEDHLVSTIPQRVGLETRISPLLGLLALVTLAHK